MANNKPLIIYSLATAAAMVLGGYIGYRMVSEVAAGLTGIMAGVGVGAVVGIAAWLVYVAACIGGTEHREE